MNREKIKLVFNLTLIILVTGISGCRQKHMSDYTTPEATYKTYQVQARALRLVADERSFRRAIRCFTDTDWKWFHKNFDKIILDKEEFYSDLYKSKKMAYVFGNAVLPLGPYPDELQINFKQISDNEVLLTVKGYSKEIRIRREKESWRMAGLFGIRENITE